LASLSQRYFIRTSCWPHRRGVVKKTVASLWSRNYDNNLSMIWFIAKRSKITPGAYQDERVWEHCKCYKVGWKYVDCRPW
jgi:hypothetical protein